MAPLTEIEKEVVLKSFGEMIKGLVSNMKNLQCCPHAISLGVGRQIARIEMFVYVALSIDLKVRGQSQVIH